MQRFGLGLSERLAVMKYLFRLSDDEIWTHFRVKNRGLRCQLSPGLIFSEIVQQRPVILITPLRSALKPIFSSYLYRHYLGR